MAMPAESDGSPQHIVLSEEVANEFLAAGERTSCVVMEIKPGSQDGLILIARRSTMAFERITIDHDRMGGLPCIRGLSIPVSTVIGQLAAGRTIQEILEDYPDLERADVYAALEYAAVAVAERELPLAASR